MKARLVGLLVAVPLLIGTATALASPPEVTVGAHGHHIVLPDGTRGPDVGPDACSKGSSIAFQNFHNNGHAGMPGLAKNGVIAGHGC